MVDRSLSPSEHPCGLHSMDERAFWLSVRRRRRLFFLWWIGWLPFGLIGIVSLTTLFPGADFVVGLVVLSAWYIVWLYIARSIR